MTVQQHAAVTGVRRDIAGLSLRGEHYGRLARPPLLTADRREVLALIFDNGGM